MTVISSHHMQKKPEQPGEGKGFSNSRGELPKEVVAIVVKR